MKKIGIFLFLVLVFVLGWHFRDSFFTRRHLAKEWSKGGFIFRDRIRATPGIFFIDHYYEGFFTEILSENGGVKKRVEGGFTNLLRDGSLFNTLGEEVYLWGSDGKILWKRFYHFQHDVWINEEEGTIFFLSGENKKRPGETRFTRKDSIVGLNLKGEQIFYWSIKDHLNKIEKVIKRKIRKSTGMNRDVYTHFNSVQEIPENSNSKMNPAFRKGNILVSERGNGLFFIIDRKTSEIVWHSDPKIIFSAHDLRMLENGMIVFLLNRQVDKGEKKFSSIAFLNPITNTIEKNIILDPPESFYTEHGGSLQLVAEGRYLVTDSLSGRVFEVNENGEVLLEWVNSDNSKEKITPIYRVMMYPKEVYLKSFL